MQNLGAKRMDAGSQRSRNFRRLAPTVPTRREAAIALTIRAFHILTERIASGELKVEDESGAIILGGTAESFSELLLELQRGHTLSAEPIAAIAESKSEGPKSLRSDEEPPARSSAADEVENFDPDAVADAENAGRLPSPA